jgi:adenylate cyclase
MPPFEIQNERTIRLAGEQCRELRMQRGLSREALSELSSGTDALSVATIKRAELGHSIYPASAACLARTLGVPLERLLFSSPEPAQAPTDTPESERVGQASVAVLPFDALDDDPQSIRFAEGIAADITHRLASFWFPVIARASSFRMRSSTAPPSGIGEQLGADYLVGGSARIHEARVRLIASLVRARDGRQVWTHVYEAPYSDVLALQAQLARDIGGEIGATMLAIEGSRYERMDLQDLDAWALGLRSAWHLHRSTAEDTREARVCAQRAMEREPHMPLPRYVLVVSHQHDLVNQWTSDAKDTLEQMVKASAEFERAVPADPMMYVATAYACVARGARSEAMERLESALEYDPNFVRAHSLYGQVLAMSGRPDQGIHELELARTLSPRDPAMWTMLLPTALAHFVAERYEDAVTWARRAVLDRPQVPLSHGALAAAYAQLGDLESARLALRRLHERDSQLSKRGVLAILGSTESSIAERFLEGLRLAGLKG